MSNDAPNYWGRLGRLHKLAPWGLFALVVVTAGMCIYATITAITRDWPVFYLLAAGAAYMAFTFVNLLKQARREGIAEFTQAD